MRSRLIPMILLSLFIVISNAFAQIDKNITYQGILKNADATIVTDGDYQLTFKLYDVESGGTALWTETQTVSVSNGLFSAYLGTETAITLDFNSQYWLGITVASGSEMTPRTKIVTSPYSIFASSIADNSVTTGKISDNSVTLAKISPDGASSGQTIMYDGTNIVWGTASGSGFSLPYTGTTDNEDQGFMLTNTGTGKAIVGKNTGTGPAGFFEIDNSENTNPALTVTTNGTGDAGLFIGKLTSTDTVSITGGGIKFPDGTVQNTAATGATLTLPFSGSADEATNALIVTNTGSGKAVTGQNTGTGHAGYFNINNSSNTSDALVGLTNGSGNAGYFLIDNGINSGSAISAITAGRGYGIKSEHIGEKGSAGLFRITNGSNDSVAVKAINNGTGSAGFFQINNTLNGEPALYAVSNGLGVAALIDGKLTATDTVTSSSGGFKFPDGSVQTSAAGSGGMTLPYVASQSSDATLLSITNTGTGWPAFFEITDAANTNDGLTVRTAGDGNAIRAKSTGLGWAGYFIKDRDTYHGGGVYIESLCDAEGLYVKNTSDGHAAKFETTGNLALNYATVDIQAESGGPGLLVTKSGFGTAMRVSQFTSSYSEYPAVSIWPGSGKGLEIYQNNTTNDSTQILVHNLGTGDGGTFFLENTSNSRNAVRAITMGSGSGLLAESNGTGDGLISYAKAATGRAGLFQNQHTTSSDPVLETEQKGSSNAAYFKVTNSANTDTAVVISHSGTAGTGLRVSTNYGDACYFYNGQYGNGARFATAIWAAWFDGNVNISGTLSKTAGSFMIDHPLDPENKVLRHSFVESPEMMNIYKGRTRLENGEITIDLPDYFDALNHPDTREVTLTCVNGWSPLFLDGKIENNKFTVKTTDIGDGSQEFSWVIYGVRNDDYARENPIIVEEEKDKNNKNNNGLILSKKN